MIHGYDGEPGDGKTSAAVNVLWASRARRVTPYANIPLYDLRVHLDKKSPLYGKPLNPATFGYPWSTYLETVDDFLGVRRGLVLLDECDMWFSAVEWQKIGFHARAGWTQHRKKGLNVMWTCTHLDRMLNVIRDITAMIFRCSRIPFLNRWSVQKMFKPNETSTTRKTTMMQLLRMHEHLWQLYHSDFVVGNGAEEGDKRGVVAASFGGAELGTSIEVKTGTMEQWLHLAWLGTVYQPANDNEFQQVAPLLRPGESRQLILWVQRIMVEGDHATPNDRATAARLMPILAQLSASKVSSYRKQVEGTKGLPSVVRAQTEDYIQSLQLFETGGIHHPMGYGPMPKAL